MVVAAQDKQVVVAVDETVPGASSGGRRRRRRRGLVKVVGRTAVDARRWAGRRAMLPRELVVVVEGRPRKHKLGGQGTPRPAEAA